MSSAGFVYIPDVIDHREEERFLRCLHALPAAPVHMYGRPTKRRVVSFGLDYRPGARRLERAAPIPPFLAALRCRAARAADIDPAALEQALVTMYPAGSAIGWHTDHPQFGDTIVAVSLQGSATLELRPKGGDTMLRQEIKARSVYVLQPLLRYGHEHRVLAHEERVSVTFRSLSAPRDVV